ncbi:hypothetical protein SEA_BILLNYE_191 [Streptomyces phage BillNye]|uniref:Uncharacterized protein n=2 Tax=Wilnyevirus billnye TaxID=2560486 RepID=A0A2L1IW70_9CAUD|nr:hypothetical protein FDJ30_gp070 [Streptomyces phage BillNye]AVD99363.1 hypothetical protein SEA_BILLNYE_191 [Streptomyces phage BillNye]QBZ72446.1 hypothetical protein SEA_CIRCINUS_192 [Streptomyces phage Circinus]
MTEVLYHSDIFLPGWFTAPTRRVKVDYGHHAKREALADRYGEIALPAYVNLKRFRVIEVGVINGRVSKILFRGKLDNERDLCIVLIPRGDNPWRCKTVWVNLNSDKHKTLDRSRYAAA